MRARPRSIRHYPAIAMAAVAALCAGGCRLETGIIPNWTTVSPAQVCPGDEVTASYDFLRTETCRDEALCATYHPTVVVSSSPEAFTPRSFTAYTGRFTFTAPAGVTTVGFDVDRDSVRVPTTRVDAEGRPIDFVMTDVEDRSRQVLPITGSQETELVHDGMCAGSTPVNSPESLPGPPTMSPNLRLVSLCNRNGVPVVVTLNGGPGSTYTQTLSPGECLNTSAPGVPAGTDAARVVEVRPMVTDPSVRCSGIGPSTPPPALRTVAVMACR